MLFILRLDEIDDIFDETADCVFLSFLNVGSYLSWADISKMILRKLLGKHEQNGVNRKFPDTIRINYIAYNSF